LPEVLGVDETRVEPILRDWRRRGWLIADSDHTTAWRRIGGVRVRLVALSPQVWGSRVEEPWRAQEDAWRESVMEPEGWQGHREPGEEG
jgi:hypothetical protein